MPVCNINMAIAPPFQIDVPCNDQKVSISSALHHMAVPSPCIGDVPSGSIHTYIVAGGEKISKRALLWSGRVVSPASHGRPLGLSARAQPRARSRASSSLSSLGCQEHALQLRALLARTREPVVSEDLSDLDAPRFGHALDIEKPVYSPSACPASWATTKASSPSLAPMS